MSRSKSLDRDLFRRKKNSCRTSLTKLAACLTALSAGPAFAEAAVVEVGASGERDTGASEWRVGPMLGVELAAIEDRLAVEIGVASRVGGSAERETEVILKKPFQLSPKMEFMLGAGPTWTHASDPAERENSFGATLALDFMVWPSDRFGWFFGPSWGYAFDSGHDHSLEFSVGLLIRLSRHGQTLDE